MTSREPSVVPAPTAATSEDEPLPEQRSFIERSVSSHGLLAAGPGTGKTWVLERRSRHLVGQGIEGSDIAILTLTNAMAVSLSERIEHGSASTVHSFALTQLNQLGDSWGKTVCTPWEERALVIEDLKLSHNIAFSESPCDVRDVARFLRRMGEGFSNNQEVPPSLTAVEQRLLQVLRSHKSLFAYALLNELVFDLLRVLELGEVLPKPPSHVLVDEYQDLTAGELRLLQELAERYGTWVNACGDDRQSIYGFRSADPLALHRFADAYGTTGGDSLSRSRRLPKLICELANAVASALPEIEGLERPDLSPWDDDAADGLVEVRQARSIKDEFEFIGSQIASLLSSGRKPEEMIIVAATAHDAALASLSSYAEPIAGIAFTSGRKQDEDPSPTELLLRAISELLDNQSNQMAWRLLAYLCPGLGQARIEAILQSDEPTYDQRVRRVAESDTRVNKVVTSVEIIDSSGVDSTDMGQVEDLVRSIADNMDMTIESDELTSLLEERSSSEEEVAELPVTTAADSIVVHTIHSAKGLEAPVVFLCTTVTEAFTGRSDAGDGLRKLFVALTRSSEELLISAPRYITGTALSRKLGTNIVSLADPVQNASRSAGIAIQSMAANT